jgi:hypothetical protein
VTRAPAAPAGARRVTELARVVLPPFVVARVLVAGSLALARHLATELHATPRPVQLGQGLLAWDGAFYADIARGGYDAVPREGLRFFPLFPVLGRALAALPGVDADLGLIVVANLSALVVACLLYRLAQRETGDAELARRAVWLVALAPSAFVFVIGYAEATLMAFTLATALAVRSRRWWWAAVFGYFAGLARPVGVLIVVFVVVELVTTWKEARGGTRVAQVAAVLAPPAGLLTYLLWVQARTNEGLFYALRIHETPRLRGKAVNPLTNVGDAFSELFSGDRFGSGLHALTAVALLVLVVVLIRRWPWPYTAYAVVTLATALTASNLDSLERYALSTFPFVLAGATLLRASWERVVWTVCGAGFVALCLLTFTGQYVP